MTRKVTLKPLSVHSVKFKFLKQLGMIHNMKTFTEVEQYKKTNMTLIHGLMDAIGNLYERRFG